MARERERQASGDLFLSMLHFMLAYYVINTVCVRRIGCFCHLAPAVLLLLTSPTTLISDVTSMTVHI